MSKKEELLDKLKNEFKKRLPGNEELCRDVVEAVVEELGDPARIKERFSELVVGSEERVKEAYFAAEREAGSDALVRLFSAPQESHGHVDTEVLQRSLSRQWHVLDRFFLSVAQGRKTRAGYAFEWILRAFFDSLGYPYDWQATINGKPDFVFPRQEHFKAEPTDAVVLTAKRTVRERWRQIVTEGSKGYRFFLATIDPEVAISSIDEMLENRIYLVAPRQTAEGSYSRCRNVVSYEKFFELYLDPAMERWRNKGVL